MDYDKKINRLKEKIKELQECRVIYDSIDAHQGMALLVHDFCNHSCDDYDWSHEIKDGIHDWDKPIHKKILSITVNLMDSDYSINDLRKIEKVGFKISI